MSSLVTLCLIFSLLSLPTSFASAFVPTVTLSGGTISGTQCPAAPNAIAFRGIPYAESPVGALRFAPPVPLLSPYAGGHLNATQNPPSCIQFGEGFKESGPTSEDCLFLNIYTPANATKDSALPVRVWLYGGSNTDGGIANPLYDGCNVASHDAIMVSVNYRLGPFGFLTLDEAGITGNQAVKDQILALRWTQDNIGAFGGDPRKVMLHGQSAGARDAFTLATLDEAPELFSSAIFQSGAGRDSTTYGNAQKIGDAYAAALNCNLDDLSCLHSASISDLVSEFQSLPILSTGFGHFPGLTSSSVLTIDMGPTVDGDLIKAQPSEVGVKVPSVFGYTSRDGAFFVATSPAFANPLAISAQNYTSFLAQSFGSSAATLVESHIPFATFHTSSAPGFAALEYVFTASEYQCSAYRAAQKAVQNGVRAWMYKFDHTPSCPWLPGLTSQEVKQLGATHTSEIPFVFGIVEDLPPPNGTCNFSAAEKSLSNFILESWKNMAATQSPASENVWPAFGGGNDTQGLEFDERPEKGPIDFRICELFDAIRDAQIKNAENGGGEDAGTKDAGSTIVALPQVLVEEKLED